MSLLTDFADDAVEIANRLRGLPDTRLQPQQKMVLEIVRTFPGSTARELANYSTKSRKDEMDLRFAISRRLPELERFGLVVPGPVRTCGISECPATTWSPVESTNK